MKQRTPQQATAHYYSRLGSRLGYLFVMKRSQHFGYYDDQHPTESAAQENYHAHFEALLELKPGMKVLDAGCGQGVVACYLAANNDVQVTGITITPYEVKVSRRRAHQQGLNHRTEFLLADYADPPFAPNTFDRIYTTETLSHAVDVTVVIETFMKLLKPGGMLICAEYEMDYKNFDAKTKAAADQTKKHAAIHGMYQFGKGEFFDTLQRAGFTQIKETDWTSQVLPSFARLRRIARPIARVAERAKLQKFFVNTLAARLYADGVEDGVFAYKTYVAHKPTGKP